MFEVSQLQSLSLQEVKDYKQKAIDRKAELIKARQVGGKEWNHNMQEELDEIAVFLCDVDDVIAGKEKEVATSEKLAGYEVAPGSEDFIHLAIIHGHRFNPNTGKEISKPFVQIYSYAEWQNFKDTYKDLGYEIVKVLHDPFNEAEKYLAR